MHAGCAFNGKPQVIVAADLCCAPDAPWLALALYGLSSAFLMAMALGLV